jgi:long-chain acyl-CoA synthetase
METSADRIWFAAYDEGVPRTISYPEITLPDLLKGSAERFPNAVATTFFGASLRYGELWLCVQAFAAGLQRMGLQKGDRVAVVLPNSPQFIISYYGSLLAGAVVVPTNPLYTPRELEDQLRDSGARFAVVLDRVYDRISQVRSGTALEKIVVTRINEYFPPFLRLLYPIKARREGTWPKIPQADHLIAFKDVMAAQVDELKLPDLRPTDLAQLQYTGGTTGIPKGAMLSHRNLVANTLQCRAWFRDCVEGAEVLLAVLPFFHVYGLTVAMNFGVAIAAQLVIHPRFQIDEVLKDITRYRPTLFPGVPTMYIAVVNHPKASQYNLRSIKACLSGAAPLPVEVAQRFEQLTGGKLVEGYGLTEASPVTHCNPLYGRRKWGSIGVPMPDTDAAIFHLETNEPLPPGQPGELAVKGPQVMMGYWNRPDETSSALRDGWLLTGDIATMDDDGYFYIVDRKKDMILVGGFSVFPREIEEVLYQHPAVQEAVAVGVPDPYSGEAVKAFVVLKEGHSATEEEILAFARERLAGYKRPREVEFRTDLPKSLVGKHLRRLLAEEERARRQS